MSGYSASVAERVLTATGAQFSLVHHDPSQDHPHAAQQCDLPMDHSVKTLVFVVPGGGAVLVVAPALARISYGHVATSLNVSRGSLRKADEADLARLGVEPSGVGPFVESGSTVVLADPAVARMGVVFLGSGQANRTVVMSGQELLRVLVERGAAVAQLAAAQESGGPDGSSRLG